jgi:BlaI family penicillinase repressor
MRTAKPDPTLLGERELDLMQALWRLDDGTVSDVHAALRHIDPPLAYTTVQTMLNRLEAKGYVRREREGRAFRYVPLVQQPAAQQSAVRRILKRFFDGSTAALAAHLVESGLDDRDLDQISRLIQDQRKRGRKR